MNDIFTKKEKKFLIAMGLVMGFRELSMTMLNPFITIYAATLKWDTPFLCGLSLGIYGLTNALFQIPYGSLSDRIGRKPVILIGLIQLSVGLFLAGLAKNIYILIFARALQGSGAVMAIAYSWVGDSIEDEKKSRAMGISGVIVALGAVLAFALGPMLYNLISVNNMFIGCSFLIFLSIIFILFFIEEKRDGDKIADTKNSIFLDIKLLLKNKTVLFLSICGFIFNYIMSEMFMIVPDELKIKIGANHMWYVFLPAIIVGIVTLKIATNIADKKNFVNVTVGAFLAMSLGFILIYLKMFIFIFIGTIFILSGFMCLTSIFPSVINKEIEKDMRGTANGVFQTMTFLGFFVGPTITGYFLEYNFSLLIYIIPITAAIFGAVLVYKLGLIKSYSKS
ncbi:Predicted arabinose efflux permease, MFS family [Clostridium cavendishii DSM 21758]|uniref:Predicted arabinose efflux permease, MFS family n=1 Tax=Clostridium cavendishii DSM 21758 TaxID=1121302 RepID=A0A1M6KWL4_9CLOT|nr:MFS transporter [Clostridium cavendishii]SHJ63282.1 Predicted arabinose efflux permease, MFS family [Clostridium cavendishii DSM 21758]